MKVSTSWVRAFLGFAVSLCVASSALAQDITSGDPGFFVRAIDTSGTVNSYETHNNVLALGDVLQVHDSVQEVLNFNGSGFPDDLDWPTELAEDFVVRGIADVTIPAGNWGVGWGSDDGGQLSLPGVEFVTRFNTAGDLQPDDQLIYDGNRGYNTTWGSFSLDEPLDTTLNVSMWERGGGDNFDVFFIDLGEQYDIEAADLTDAATDTPSQENLWSLIAAQGSDFDDEFQANWNPRVPAVIPGVAIPVSPGQKISGVGSDFTTEEVGGVQEGLLHYWYGRNNPGSLEGVNAFYELGVGPIEDPDVPPFNPENTWWTGNQAALEGGTTPAPKYPVNILDQPRLDGGTFSGDDINNYTTVLTGELRVPRDGEYLFADGIDDLTVVAIDANQDGEFDPDTEIVINDNAWTNLQRDANNGGFTTNGGEYIPISFDVPEDGNCDDPENAADGCWFKIEVIAAEGGGTDAGIIYWNENADIDFPAPAGDGRQIADEDIQELAIPEDHMRGPGGIVITGGNLAATLNNEHPYEFNISEDGTHDSLEVNRPNENLVTALDFNGATIDVVADGDISALGDLQLFIADSISGELTLNLPEGVAGTFNAETGVLTLGEGGGGGDGGGDALVGDIDGDGEVAFGDFLILSGAFGNSVDPGTGADLDGSGEIDFGDFLLLSGNFGATAAAASAVPEPSALALLGVAGLFAGLLRRRR